MLRRTSRDGTRRGLALVRLGYFLVVGIIVVAVLPFTIDTLHAVTTLQRQLSPAEEDARTLAAAASDEESGIRGYLITEDDTFLSSFVTGSQEANQSIARLHRLSLHRNERAALDATTTSLGDWRTQSALVDIADTRAGNVAKARSMVATATGRRLFENFREKISQFVSLIETRAANQRRALHRDSELAIFALLIASAVGIFSASVVRRRIRRSIEGEEQRLREQLALADIQRLAGLLAASRSPEDVGRIGVREAARVLGAEGAHLWMNSDRERLVLVGSTDSLAAAGAAPGVLARSDDNAPAVALRTNEAAFFASRGEYAHAYPDWVSVIDVVGALASAVVPTSGQHDAVGVLEVFYDTEHHFSQMQRTALLLVAGQLGRALERAQTRDREYAAAERLQQSLLGPRLPVPGVGHTTRYLPATSAVNIGGDWHNAQRLPGGRVLIAIGDVVGRGLEAATVMGQMRAAVSACAPRCETPAELLVCLDEFAGLIPGATSTTVALAFVDTESETLSYICAGHPPPIVVSPEGHIRLLNDATTWPLALKPARSETLGHTVAFPAGSLVLLYSDGLVERRHETLDVGIDRVVHALTDGWNLPLDALCDRVLSNVLPEQSRDDDLAMLALRSPVANDNIFLVEVDASPAAARDVRHQLRTWLRDHHLDADDELAVLVAVGEACTNAIEHAYSHEGPKVFRVEACPSGDQIMCCVTDSGAWKDNAVRTARGNGLAIMQELMDDVLVDRRTTGTAVTLTYRPGGGARASVVSN